MKKNVNDVVMTITQRYKFNGRVRLESNRPAKITAKSVNKDVEDEIKICNQKLLFVFVFLMKEINVKDNN